MPNFHDHRGVVDNGLNDGLDFLKDIVRQAKEINSDIDYVFVFNQPTVEAALYLKDANFFAHFDPANPPERDFVYCHNFMENVDASEQDGICNQTGLSFYQIKMALCRLFGDESKFVGSRDRLQRIVAQHATSGRVVQYPVERWAIKFFVD